MSRAKAAADPQREVLRGATASLWFIDDPATSVPASLYRREMQGTLPMPRNDAPPPDAKFLKLRDKAAE